MGRLPVLSTGVLVALAVSSVLAADKEPPPTKTYIVEGEGETERDALADAFARAVQLAVGAYITAEKKLDASGDVMKEIITFSNGYIQSYKAYPLPPKPGGGKVRLSVHAQVEDGKVLRRLDKAAVLSERGKEVLAQEVDGKQLFARTVTDQKRKETAAALLRAAILRMPLKTEFQTVALDKDNPKEPVQQAPGDFVYQARYHIGYDLQRVVAYGQWVDDLLSKARISKSRKEYEETYELHDLEGDGYGVRILFHPARGGLFNTFRDNGDKHPLEALWEADSKRKFDEKMSELVILVGYAENKNTVKMKWAVHQLEVDILRSATWFDSNRPPPADPLNRPESLRKVDIALVDKDGKSVRADQAIYCYPRDLLNHYSRKAEFFETVSWYAIHPFRFEAYTQPLILDKGKIGPHTKSRGPRHEGAWELPTSKTARLPLGAAELEKITKLEILAPGRGEFKK